MRISDWSSDVCSSDLRAERDGGRARRRARRRWRPDALAGPAGLHRDARHDRHGLRLHLGRDGGGGGGLLERGLLWPQRQPDPRRLVGWEEGRGGEEWVRTWRLRWGAYQ